MQIFRDDILRGRRAFVTGGGSGICKGIALALAAHGADVAVTSRKQENLDATAAEIQALGRKGLGVAADVRDGAQVEQALAKTAEALGGIDLVVNGAAGNFLAPVAQLSYNGFRTVIDIDLMGTFNVCRAALSYLEASKQSPSVLNISATLHYGGTPMQSHVSAAKAGIDALTRNLAVEWGSLGIRVNAIAPGPIDSTEGVRRLLPADLREKMEQDVPLQRFGQVQEIADAALFLSSDAAKFIHGEVLVVDGGRWLNNKLLS